MDTMTLASAVQKLKAVTDKKSIELRRNRLLDSEFNVMMSHAEQIFDIEVKDDLSTSA